LNCLIAWAPEKSVRRFAAKALRLLADDSTVVGQPVAKAVD
jgi:hypothetical protein